MADLAKIHAAPSTIWPTGDRRIPVSEECERIDLLELVADLRFIASADQFTSDGNPASEA